MNNDKYLSVTALTRYIKYKIDNDNNLQEVFLKGEISNFKEHTRGHLYFTIKDEASRMNAIMFNYNAKKVKFKIEDGMKILVKGKISVFEATGNYQIYVEDLMEDGLGNLHIAFEQLKKKLSDEGLFDKSHKQVIPKVPLKLGIITASTGAAIKDIHSTIKRRFPICNTILFPSLVQGEAAKNDIVKNIQIADSYNLDVIILGRGGGSIEDLWPFNEEVVARAIYNAKTPIISAVGHEVDWTISDFVADLRAETPTAAAERAVPVLENLVSDILNNKTRMYNVIMNIINQNKLKLKKLKESYILKNPLSIYEIKEQKLDNVIDKVNTSINSIIYTSNSKLDVLKNSYVFKSPDLLYNKKEHKFNVLIEKLTILNPLSALKRGYAIVKKDGITISNIKKIKENDEVKVDLEKGSFKAKIMEVNNG
ncbi:MAG: exodeoxyribonuclease VII large subunit [Bacilli bacterium]